MKLKTIFNASQGLLLVFFFIFSSCYVYKPYTGIESTQTNTRVGARGPGATTIRGADSNSRSQSPQRAGISESLSREEPSAPVLSKEDMEDNLKNINEQERQKKEELEMSNKMTPARKAEMDIEFQKRREAQAGAKPKTSSKEMEMGILKSKIKPNKYYKIKVQEREYKIQADQWEGDTLVSHILRNPKKVLRFHENQIDEEELMERRFSKPYSDLFTIGAYVAGGAAVLLLLL